MIYNIKHKIVLQTLMNEGVLVDNKIKDLVIKLFNKDDISLIINEINEKLQCLHMSIKRAQCEITGEVHWVLISTILDEVSRYQTEFAESKLALLRTIFSEIITSNNGCIQSTTCLNLCSLSVINLSKAEANKFLEDMVRRRWLAHKGGHYYMGVRSITELMPYFKATYENNLSTCGLCKQVIFHGNKCNNCEIIFHLYCLKRYLMVNNSMKCPSCYTIISDIDLSGIVDDSSLTKENANQLI